MWKGITGTIKNRIPSSVKQWQVFEVAQATKLSIQEGRWNPTGTRSDPRNAGLPVWRKQGFSTTKNGLPLLAFSYGDENHKHLPEKSAFLRAGSYIIANLL